MLKLHKTLENNKKSNNSNIIHKLSSFSIGFNAYVELKVVGP